MTRKVFTILRAQRWLRMNGTWTNLTAPLLGPSKGLLKLPWTKLVAPELTDGLIDTIVEGTEVQAAGRTVKEMEQLRDACLIAIMNTLREFNQGAGNIVSSNEARRLQAVERKEPWAKGAEIGAPLKLYRCNVKPEWVDYNGHMSEAEFLTAFGTLEAAEYAQQENGGALLTWEELQERFK